jgi:N-methylhydantoinase A/oxoprolinase/acetone carboxylase beta subunit
MRTESPVTYALGIDIGGTFTDVVVRSADGALRLTKVPTTRNDPSVSDVSALGTH